MSFAERIHNGLLNKEQSAPFYATPELTQRLNLIKHLLQNSEQLLLVLAEKGCGKTTLLNQIIAGADKHWKIFNPAGSPNLSESALLNTLLGSFNVRPEGKTVGHLREALRSHIAATRYNGLLPVLLVDDAHMLPLETLSLLVRLVMTGEPQTRMRVLLFCEPQITSVFAAPEFEIMRNTLIHTLDIPPFSVQQVGGYLQFRFNQIKYAGGNPFTDPVIHRIYHDSEGIPGYVEELGKKVLGAKNADARGSAFSSDTAPRTPQIQRLPLLTGLGIVFVLLLLLFAWLKTLLFPPSEEEFKPLPLPPAGEQMLPLTPTPAAAAIDDVAPSPPETELAPVMPEADSVPVESGTETETASEIEVPAEEPEPAEEPKAELISASDISELAGVKSSAWLRKQSPDAFTVQILTTEDKRAVSDFLARYKLQGEEVAMFTTQQKGRVLYKLVYGIFPDRAKAKAELQKLPPRLRRNTRPWIRSLVGIQQEIQK